MTTPAIAREYRKARAPLFHAHARGRLLHITPASTALRNVREAIAIRALERAGFLAIVDVGDDPREIDRESEGASVRIVAMPDYDGVWSVLDFDCCGDADTPRVRCDCEIDRSTNSHVTPRARLNKRRNPAAYIVTLDDAETGRTCRYGQTCKHKCDQAQQLEREGAYGIVAEYRDPVTGDWTHAESVWGFVGDDWRESGYVPDMLDAARSALRDAYHAIAQRARDAVRSATIANALTDTRSI